MDQRRLRLIGVAVLVVACCVVWYWSSRAAGRDPYARGESFARVHLAGNDISSGVGECKRGAQAAYPLGSSPSQQQGSNYGAFLGGCLHVFLTTPVYPSSP